MSHLAIRILCMAGWVYVGLMLVLTCFQRNRIYHPTRSTEEEAMRQAASEDLQPWRDAQGEIIGWRPVHALASADALLLFHGNAGCAVQRGYWTQGFAPRMEVYLFEYPGYGARTGRPGEKAFFAAGEAALLQLRRERPGRIFLGGESLGTGVACGLAGAHPERVSGLFLSTPFSSLVDVARSHFPFYPASWLMRDRYDNVRHLQRYRGPVAILLAGQDEVVPARLGRKLHDTYAGPKKLWEQADRSHNTLEYEAGNAWWDEVVDFLQGKNGR